MNAVKVLGELRSGRAVTIRGTWKPSVLRHINLRLVPNFVTGSRILWSIGVYRDGACVRRWPALDARELEERLLDMKVCQD